METTKESISDNIKGINLIQRLLKEIERSKKVKK